MTRVRVFRTNRRDRHEWVLQTQRDGRALEIGQAERVVLKHPELVVDPALRERYESLPEGQTCTHAWAEGELWSVGNFRPARPRLLGPEGIPSNSLPEYVGLPVAIRYDIQAGRFEPAVTGVEYLVIDGGSVLAYLYPSA